MCKKGWIFCAISLISGISWSQSNALNTAAETTPALRISELSFIDTSVNYFQAHQASLIGSLVEQVGLQNTAGFSVLHIGDELVGDLSPMLGEALFGKGRGPGLFFPGSLINHALPAEVETQHTGDWVYATPVENNRILAVGITGYAARTEDLKSSLSVSIPTGYGKNIDKFTMYCERSEQHFDVLVTCLGAKKADGRASVITKKEFPASISYRNAPYLEFAVPAGTKEILIQFKQIISTQKSFVLHGISLTNSNQGNLHSVGMRGCGFQQFNRLELLKQHLIQLSPNVILLDFGAHDNYRGPEDEAIYLEPIKRSIQILKEAVPSSKIVVVIPQDGIRGGRTLSTFEKYEKAIIALCKTEKVAYYDYYRVAGGKYSAQYWADFQLFMSDGLHLQEQGTSIKGQLYAAAWHQTAKRYGQGYRQFVIAEDTSKRLAFRTRDTLSKNIMVSEVWRYHVVRRGETAYRIALRYGITTAQLKEWNHLRNYNISAGMRLKVGKLAIATKADPIQTIEMKDSADADAQNPAIVPTVNEKPKTVDTLTTSPKPKPEKNPVKPKIAYHKVKTGETLYSISKAYGLTVDQLKRMNGLRSNNIAVGRLLRVQ
jgi:LysM repeat protein/lysophospholipase L1-like esterase